MTNISIARLPGEYWWGGAINEGSAMPFGRTAHTRDLRVTDDNQASPLLLSSKGRYIWSEEPFAFRVDENGLSVFDSAGEVVVEEGHNSLQGPIAMPPAGTSRRPGCSPTRSRLRPRSTAPGSRCSMRPHRTRSSATPRRS
ncbi:hypothetical protein HMSSN036_59240 [Paenibacillus macerans]|nr:hypothetical protein HMSSN036_59240 [Paenibacillus macerans]